MTAQKETWLPNLVGGVSIWKLATDLNQDRFFDGRLLVPETEGADSLPVKVIWNVDGLVPLAEARTSHPEATQEAVVDFIASVDRVKKELSSDSSGYRRFKEAFTMPAIDGEGVSNYFFDPKAKKLCVINWGASPRSLAGQGELVFGYDRFDELMRRAGPGMAATGLAAGAAGAAAGAAAAGAAGDPAQAAPDPKGDKKAENEDGKKNRLWLWIALAIGLVILIVLLGLLLKDCGKTPTDGADAGTDAGLDAGTDGGDAGDASDAGDAGDAADSGDASTDAADARTDADNSDAADASADAAFDAGDAGDAGKDGGDARKDGGDGSGPPANGKVYPVKAGGGKPGPGGSGSGSGSGSGAGSGSGSGSGSGAGSDPGGGDGKPHKRPSRPIPFRSHFQPEAVAWRISSGADIVSDDYPPELNEGAFEVYLKPGHTFSEITVEYRDKSGEWHSH